MKNLKSFHTPFFHLFIFVLCLLISNNSFSDVRNRQEEINVKGKIIDSLTKQPLAGVTVIELKSKISAISDVNGEFTLTKVPSNGKLVISFLGMNTIEINIDGKKQFLIELSASSSAIDEVIVVGYGVQKRETLTGSVAVVQGTELEKSPAINLSNTLAGRLPGVVATNSSGEPGYDGSSIRIRGINTLGDSGPLVVIDGIPARTGGLERLNSVDIDNISVLKDASAAIYGARAANGVILITTKKGKLGKPNLSYSFNKGYSQPTVIPELADAAQYAEMSNELEIYKLPVEEWAAALSSFNSSGSYTTANGTVSTAPFSPEDIQLFIDGTDPWHHPNTDWFDATLKEWSPQEKHNVQINGGTDDFTYLMSLGYQNQDGYYKNSATGYQQYDMRINLDAKINKYIKTQFGILGRQENRDFPTKSAYDIFRMLMRGDPTQPAYWPNGLPGPDIEYGENPVVITTNLTGYHRDKRYYFQSNGSLEITNPWVKGLKLSMNAAVDRYNLKTKRWEIPWILYTWQGDYEADGVTPLLVGSERGPAEPNLTQSDEDQLNIFLGSVLSYENTFDSHYVNFLAGVNRETIRNDSFSAYRRYFLSDGIDYLFAGGDEEKDNDGSAWERARLNYFGRVNYNYKSKYLIEFLWRYDGSYMFPDESRYGFFPGIMVGWLASEEGFWKKNVPFINYFKIRASYGQMGNDNIYYDSALQEYQYYSTYSFGSYIIDNEVVNTLYETRVPNEFITWEVANNYNLGFDFQFLEGRFNAEFDIFKNRRNSILWRRNASIPESTGMILPAENIGVVDNAGYEFNVGYKDKFGDFGWRLSVNGGYAKNEIVFWDEAPGAPEWQQSTGKPINTSNYYIYDGVFATQEEIDNNTIDYSSLTGTLRPGDMKYLDYNGDGRITGDDMVRRDKSNVPTFQGGLNIGLTYKDFDLSILFQGATGAEIRVGTEESGAIGNYLLEFYENRWTIENPSSEHPRITDRSDQYYSYDNTYWLRSTDYIRLKNLELGYNLPQKSLSKLKISQLRLFVSGQNLSTWSKIKIYDPESTNSLGQYYPQARVINMGAFIKF
ncbi:SusC/RagA family TonB-linked outer membrane protein [Sphingobacterium hungaricum]|uniref:SusC/RagA family TonB-linked outer membrane protein n=1 Tax=Sphingobacterium hungaricum TaxID=2082723 RepID=A0A928USE4_9SPHI|nr:TonB-dependent receptor [Sphingobacterium hungaricum]MBE8712330.1 SusC/RagA family TonB-linked outer membrane protein [Sphingobacterium hungaricum]